MALIDCPRQGQSDHDRQLPTLTYTPQPGYIANRCPAVGERHFRPLLSSRQFRPSQLAIPASEPRIVCHSHLTRPTVVPQVLVEQLVLVLPGGTAAYSLKIQVAPVVGSIALPL
jgi:hypothetical protein